MLFEMSVRSYIFSWFFFFGLSLTMSAEDVSDGQTFDRQSMLPGGVSGTERGMSLVCRSPRLAGRSPSPSVFEWPAERILGTLRLSGLIGNVPRGAFRFLLASTDELNRTPSVITGQGEALSPRWRTFTIELTHYVIASEVITLGRKEPMNRLLNRFMK